MAKPKAPTENFKVCGIEPKTSGRISPFERTTRTGLGEITRAHGQVSAKIANSAGGEKKKVSVRVSKELMRRARQASGIEKEGALLRAGLAALASPNAFGACHSSMRRDRQHFGRRHLRAAVAGRTSSLFHAARESRVRLGMGNAVGVGTQAAQACASAFRQVLVGWNRSRVRNDCENASHPDGSARTSPVARRRAARGLRARRAGGRRSYRPRGRNRGSSVWRSGSR